MKRVLLKHSGRPDISFTGEQLAVLHDLPADLDTTNLWEVFLYRRMGGGYVLSSTCRQAHNGHNLHLAELFSTAEELKRYLSPANGVYSKAVVSLFLQASQRDSNFSFIREAGLPGEQHRSLISV